MKHKAIGVILCCLTMQYAYWYYSVSQGIPVHTIRQYIKHHAPAYLNSFVMLQKESHESTSTSEQDPQILTVDPILSEDDPNNKDEARLGEDMTIKAGQAQVTEVEKGYGNPPDPEIKQESGGNYDSEINNVGFSELGEDDGDEDGGMPLKKILFWNKPPSFHKRPRLTNFGLGSGRGAFLRLGCEYNACTVTGKKNMYPYDQLDAIVWHERSKDQSFPQQRSSHTRYIFMVAEPPIHLKRLGYHSNRFNWTLTYRLDSDIPIRIGQALKREVPDQNYTHINYAEGKTKMAAWFVSNCNTDSGRSNIVRQLQKYFNVDVYGRCGPFKCPRFTNVNCYEQAAQTYKFYLSFENALCRDYVTEKFFNILPHNIVPVVYGGANYDEIAPPKSYINVRSFPSIKKLAEYLLYLNSNDTAYSEYFKWRKYYRPVSVSASKSMVWCDLCKKLHVDNQTKVYGNIRNWFIRQGNCQSKKYKNIRNFINGLTG